MLDFIINPIAGGKHGKKTRKTMSIIENRLKELNIVYNIHLTHHKGHGTEITKTIIEKGATDIIVVGGDGSLHEVINGFSNFDKVNLGLIPCGTGNDFAATLNLPKNPLKALDVIINGEAKYTDYMQMPTVRGLNVIGTGIDVEVLKKYEKLKKKNKFGYTWCLIKTLISYQCADFTAEINGKEEKYRSFIAGIANGKMFGGGIPICPVADPTDKTLNFVAVKEISKLGLIGAFLKLKRGKVLDLKQAVHVPCTSIKINSEKPLTVNVDGELYDGIPFEIQVVSNTLKMYR